MPIYDYHCDHCGHAFSAVQSFKDEPLGACPSCGKRPRRLFAPPAIVFKGSGWYKTDSRASRTASKDGAPAKEGTGAAATAPTADGAKPDGAKPKEKPPAEAASS